MSTNPEGGSYNPASVFQSYARFWSAMADAMTQTSKMTTNDSTTPQEKQANSKTAQSTDSRLLEAFPALADFILDRTTGIASESWDSRSTQPREETFGRFAQDSFSATAFGDVLDRALHAQAATFTGGLSTIGLVSAFSDWWLHLAVSPGKQLQLRSKALRKSIRLWQHVQAGAISHADQTPCIEPLPQDRRFRSDAWRRPPFSLIYQAFLLNQQWWHKATTGVHGVSAKHEDVVSFTIRQLLDLAAPSNAPFLNPDVLERTAQTGGANLIQGWMNWVEDWERLAGGHPPAGAEAFRVGETLAATPGKVVFRNRLIELIQYTPTTKQVRPEPVLITPAWIMKYYILDLSPGRSLVEYLVGQGFTVFMISWRNPDPQDRDLGMQDYLDLGFKAALEAVSEIVPDQKAHAVGYCLGGTLLAIAAAEMRRTCSDRLASLSFFAAQVDFKEAGELTLFINDSQVGLLEDVMWEQGFLDTSQMAGAFQILRSNDLIFSRLLRTYLMGEREPMTDLTAWNADGTRMPYEMHSEYLRKLFLNNDLAEGRLKIDGRPVSLRDIHTPIFALGTEQDHIAPWRSVYKIHRLTDADVTFVLASGGHNGGVVSEPGRPDRSYSVSTRSRDEPHRGPDRWLEEAEVHEGSWWPEWMRWLEKMSGDLVEAPSIGTESGNYKASADAPGRYVHVK